MKSEVEKDIEQFRELSIRIFEKSREHKAAIIAHHCGNLGAMLALISADESVLLDVIDVVHRQVREHAAASFTKVQKARKEAGDWG